jgi:L-fuculose-phosphate aldolase
MPVIRQELARYGNLIAQAGLTAGAGGNISAREGRLIWVKPSGLAMAELKGTDMCCIDLDSGRQVDGKLKPTSELPMHLGVYRARPDINAIFHTHSPWASGVVSSMWTVAWTSNGSVRVPSTNGVRSSIRRW